jgi:hypothetical protein
MQFDAMTRFLSGNNDTGLRQFLPIRSSIPRPFCFSHQSPDIALHNSSFLPSITDVSTISKQKLLCFVPLGVLHTPSQLFAENGVRLMLPAINRNFLSLVILASL